MKERPLWGSRPLRWVWIGAFPNLARHSDEKRSRVAATAPSKDFHFPSVALALAIALRLVAAVAIPRSVVLGG